MPVMRIPSLLAALALTVSQALAQAPSQTSGTLALLRPGDVFEMRLFGMPAEYAAEFTAQYTVSQDGNVNIPLIGDMRAAGLTPPQIEKAIANKLVSEKIFTSPTVNINMAQLARYVVVGGGVRAPQRLVWTTDLTLNAAIDIAGGLSDFGSKKGVRLIRDGKQTSYDARKFDKDPSLDPKLLPGDQVVVPGG